MRHLLLPLPPSSSCYHCRRHPSTAAVLQFVTRSIGMLSYTFLKSTKKEDTVVPMIDYEKKGQEWKKMVRSSLNDWHLNLDTITHWSPFSFEHHLLQQFDHIDTQRTRIIIYNLWEDDMHLLELDFDADPHDIQIRGVNRDEKKIAMARKYPNSKHFLTFHHSLRSYASILYLRLPRGFRIILRGKVVKHHNLANDMVYTKEVQYKPVPITDGTLKEPNATPKNIQVMVTLGFVKDAKDHIDIQGFNVYHKNRLIKLEEANNKLAEMNKEHETLIEIFVDDRERRETEAEHPWKRLRVSEKTLTEKKDTPQILYKLWQDGFLHM